MLSLWAADLKMKKRLTISVRLSLKMLRGIYNYEKKRNELHREGIGKKRRGYIYIYIYRERERERERGEREREREREREMRERERELYTFVIVLKWLYKLRIFFSNAEAGFNEASFSRGNDKL